MIRTARGHATDLSRQEKGRGRTRALLGGALLTAALPLATSAQEERVPPGVQISLGISERLQADSNLGLDSSDPEATTQATTQLGLDLLSETTISRLAFSADATARLYQGADTDGTEGNFDGPVLRFGYDREVPDSAISVDGTFRIDEIAFLRDIEEFRNDDGVIDLPDDFEDLEGEGTRRNTSLDATLSLRNEAPLGITLRAGLNDLDYTDVSDPGELVDSRRIDIGTAVRLTFDEAVEATVGLGLSRYEEEGQEADLTRRLDLGGSIDRPLGALTAQASVENSDSGTRGSLRFGRSLAFPRGEISAALGVARDSEGNLGPSGSLSYRLEYPLGALDLSLDRTVEAGDDNDEETVTNLSASYRRELTPVSGLSLDLLYADSRPTGTENDSRNLDLGATYSRSLTPDWSIDLGYRHEVQDDETSERATNQSVFLSLSRDFLRTF